MIGRASIWIALWPGVWEQVDVRARMCKLHIRYGRRKSYLSEAHRDKLGSGSVCTCARIKPKHRRGKHQCTSALLFRGLVLEIADCWNVHRSVYRLGGYRVWARHPLAAIQPPHLQSYFIPGFAYGLSKGWAVTEIEPELRVGIHIVFRTCTT